MGLSEIIEELAAKSIRRDTEFCAYQSLYNSLSAADQKALDNAWDKGYSVSIILRAIRSQGYKTSNESIRSHRHGSCRCPKE